MPIKMSNRDKELKKQLNLEIKQYKLANPCVIGQIDNKDKNLLRKYTAKECRTLNGQLFLNGVCKDHDKNYSSICAKKIIEKPLQCGNLGKNDSTHTTYIEKGESKTMIKRIFTKDECTKLKGELVDDKYCLNKVENIDWSTSCGEEIVNKLAKIKPWGKCIREKKSGEECKKQLDIQIKQLHDKYNTKNEYKNRRNEIHKYRECMHKTPNHLQCALARKIMEDEDYRKENNLPILKDAKERITKNFIKEWKNKKSFIHSTCIKSGKDKDHCDVLANLWGEIIDYSMIDNMQDKTIDNYQKKRMDDELKKIKELRASEDNCNKTQNKLRCSFNNHILKLENNKGSKLTKEEYNDHFENFKYIQIRDGKEVKSSPSYYLADNCKNSSTSDCKFINDIWSILIDYALKDNITDAQVDEFKAAQKNKFKKRDENYFKCLKNGNEFSCGIEYNRELNKDKVSVELSAAEILEDRNKFISDFITLRKEECKNKKNPDCKYIQSVWDSEFIKSTLTYGITDSKLNELEKNKINTLKKLVSGEKINEHFSMDDKCFIGVSWSTLLQTILVLTIVFMVLKDVLVKKTI